MAYIRCSGNIGGSLKVRTASGNPCTFDTDLADTLVSLTADIVANQDLHGYDHPWAGGAGKNKIEGRSTAITEHDITVTPKGDGTFDVNGMASANCYILISSTALASGSYILNGDVSGFGTDMYLYCMPSYNRGTFTSNVEGVYLYVKSGTAVNHATIKPMVRLSTETDPTFAPYSNICPIVGHSELNLTRCGANFTDISDNTTSGAGYIIGGFPVAINADNVVLPSGIYVFSFAIQNATYPCACQLIWYRNGVEVGNTVATINSSGINSIAFTASGEFDSFVMFCNSSSGGAFTNFNLNIGSTATAYEPYNGDTFTVSFGQTVYGGVYDKSGRLTITWGAVDLGTLDWIYDSGLQRFQTTVSGIKRASGISDLATGILCEALIANSDPVMLPTQRVDNSICRYTDNDNVYVLCSAYSDAETFKTAMNGIMLAYELATPIVIDVPSISVFAENGTNNIVSDCLGDVSVSYLELIRGT